MIAVRVRHGTCAPSPDVDDPRNTDNAWMETTAFHFHCNAELGAMLPLSAGDDAADVMWLDIDASNPKYANLYASHRDWVDNVARSLRPPSGAAAGKRKR